MFVVKRMLLIIVKNGGMLVMLLFFDDQFLPYAVGILWVLLVVICLVHNFR